MSRRLEFYYEVLLEFDEPVYNHSFVLRALPHSFPGQTIKETNLELNPTVSYDIQHDSFGNILQIGCLNESHSHFHYKVQGSVATDESKRSPAEENVKGDFLPIWKLPTRYTAMSERMRKFLTELALPKENLARLTSTEEKKAIAWKLCESVNKYMRYIPGMTGVSTTAAEAFLTGSGVCQDFAHIYLTFAREAGLSARYCNGLTEGEGASHAWCEVLLDGIWTGVDPTRGKWTDETYIRFNIGRDFTDCPMERGVFSGCTVQRQSVFMKVWQIS